MVYVLSEGSIRFGGWYMRTARQLNNLHTDTYTRTYTDTDHKYYSVCQDSGKAYKKIGAHLGKKPISVGSLHKRVPQKQGRLWKRDLYLQGVSAKETHKNRAPRVHTDTYIHTQLWVLSEGNTTIWWLVYTNYPTTKQSTHGYIYTRTHTHTDSKQYSVHQEN